MENSFAARLKFFMDHKGYTSSIFADMCGIPRPSLSQLLTGRNKKVNDVLINLIHQANPELSILWLMFGEGNMIVDSDKNEDSGSDNDENVSIFSTDRPQENEKSTVNALTNANFRDNDTENQINELNLQIRSLQAQIENLRKNPRKVSQITIYYDDSTFETFYPSDKIR